MSRAIYENCKHEWSDPKEPSHCIKCGLNRVKQDGIWKYYDDYGNRLTGLAFADGEEAVAVFNKENPDLVVLDVMMPKMDGYMTTREIRTLKNNKKANIPIVAMTANVLKN